MYNKNVILRISIYFVVWIFGLLYVLRIDTKYINKHSVTYTTEQQQMIDFAIAKLSTHFHKDLSNIKQLVFFDFNTYSRTQWLCRGDQPVAGCFQPVINRIVVMWELSYGTNEICDTIVHELVHAVSYLVLETYGDTDHIRYSNLYDDLAYKWCSEQYLSNVE